MASFGRVAGGRCMQFVLVCTLLLMAAQQRSCAALGEMLINVQQGGGAKICSSNSCITGLGAACIIVEFRAACSYC